MEVRTRRKIVMVSDIDREKLIITQANVLALSAQKMTLQEKRLLLLLISQVRMTDTSFHICYIPINIISEYLELNETSLYSRIKTISYKLLSRVINIDNSYDTGYDQFQWVSKSRYLPKKRSPINTACLELKLHEDLHPLLLNLKKHFGSIPLLQIATMPSFTSIRVVEVLYYSSRKLTKKEIYFEIQEFKEKLSLNGKYNNFKDFRKDVLERAQKDCQEKSPIKFTWNEKKRGRKIIGLLFFIKENNEKKHIKPIEHKQKEGSNAKDDETIGKKASEVLERNGVDQNGRDRLIENYREEQIIENANLALRKFENGKIKNLAAATIRAVEEDWRPKKSPFEKEQEEKKQAVIQANKKKEEEKILIEKLEKEFNKQKKNKAKNIYDKKTDEEKQTLISKFEKSKHIKGIMKESYRKDGLKSVGIKILFESFLSECLLEEAENDFIKWANKSKNVFIKQGRFNEYELVKN